MKQLPLLALVLALFLPAAARADFSGHYLCKLEKDNPQESAHSVFITMLTLGTEKVPFISVKRHVRVQEKDFEIETKGLALVVSRKTPGAATIEVFLLPGGPVPPLPVFVGGQLFPGGELPNGGMASYCQKL